MAATVTIDQSYFETLLRRAEFQTSGKDLSTPVNVPLVTIPKVDHDNLLRMAHEYNCLRQSLYKGGIEQETLKILINGEDVLTDLVNEWVDGDEPIMRGTNLFSQHQAGQVLLPRANGNSFDPKDPSVAQWQSSGPLGADSGYYRWGRESYGRQNSSALEEDNDSLPVCSREDGSLNVPRPARHQYERAEQRTLLAKNLHERTTHKDLTELLRGGLVLDIFLRSNDKSASISFVEGQHAQSFLHYVKRNDTYVHGKRIEWAWNDRQFILPSHVANKISIGATRNLVIRNVIPNITAEKLREDLDHIHNLVVIDITYANSNCHISLNSIHNSLFARTCMMSRAAYKGMRIEWYEDECSLPLPEPKRTSKEGRAPPTKTKPKPTNRFQMLGVDGDDTEDGEDDDEDITTTTDIANLTLSTRTP